VEPDGVKDVKVDLSARPSSVVVTSTPSGAAVYLDGVSKGVTPCSVTDLTPGAHSVSLKKDGYEDHSGSVSVSAGRSETYSAVLRKVVVEAPVTPKPVTGTSGSTGEMILIPAGEFAMGSNDFDDEKPIHTVYLNAYYIDKYEVTVGQFRKFCNATGKSMPDQPSWNQGDNYPVVNVTWVEASAYASWAGKRLPSEAEWEKAARGTDGRKYPWGNYWDASKCNSDESGDGYANTVPVGSFPQGASPYGVMDMAGNACEWCADWYDPYYYQNSPSRNPTGPASGLLRAVRGGGWGSFSSGVRTSRRSSFRVKTSISNTAISVETALKEGKALYDEGALDEALKLYRDGFIQAKSSAEKKALNEAIAQVYFPNTPIISDVQMTLKVGYNLCNEGKPEEALKLYHNTFTKAKSPQEREALEIAIADIYFAKLQDWDGSQGAYVKIIETYPKSSEMKEFVFRLAICYEHTGDYLKAAEKYQEVATKFKSQKVELDSMALDGVERCFKKNFKINNSNSNQVSNIGFRCAR